MVFLRIAGFSLSALVIVARIRNIYHSAQVDAMHRHMRRLRAHLVLKLELIRRKRARQSDPCIDVCGEANG